MSKTQFVSFGFDDNEMNDSMIWAVDTFTKRKNPDGSKCSCGFYLTSEYIDRARESWIYAVKNGCEIACHTHTHPDGNENNFSVEDWVAEMEKCIETLTDKNSGIGIEKSEIKGFRTPFLAHNENMLKAVEKMNFLYDCSIEEGLEYDKDGMNFKFPYKFDNGVWELPAYALITPENLRDKFPEKITGFDWNVLVEYEMNDKEYLATLKHTLDLRLKGNRAPFFFGAHTGIYSEVQDAEPTSKVSIKERRKVIEDFLDYAQSKPEVIIGSPIKILEEWKKIQ
jgi:hypothetical protein